MIGAPLAGDRTLFVDIIRTRASKLGLKAQRDVHGHLVTVKVSVKGRTDQRVQLDGFTFDQNRFERLNAQDGAASAHGSA